MVGAHQEVVDLEERQEVEPEEEELQGEHQEAEEGLEEEIEVRQEEVVEEEVALVPEARQEVASEVLQGDPIKREECCNLTHPSRHCPSL